jgi:hypothetical protein
MTDRLTALEERLAALEREVARLKAERPEPTDPNDPLANFPYWSNKPPRELWPELHAQRMKELGLGDVKPMGAKKLRELMIAEGLDPTSNEFSRGIIEMREE